MNMLTNKSTHLTGQFGQGRQQGNTLIPVLIGLALMVAATLAFLSQGKALSDQNVKNLAINEITSILNAANIEKVSGTATVSLTSPGLTAINVYGQQNKYVSPKFTYITDNATVCLELANMFKDFSGVSTTIIPQCTAAAGAGAPNTQKTQLEITLR